MSEINNDHNKEKKTADGSGETMVLLRSMLYTFFVREIRTLLTTLIITTLTAIAIYPKPAITILVPLVLAYLAATIYKIITMKHEFANISSRVPAHQHKVVWAVAYAAFSLTLICLPTFIVVLNSGIDTSGDIPALFLFTSLIMVGILNTIVSLFDDFVDHGLTDLDKAREAA